MVDVNNFDAKNVFEDIDKKITLRLIKEKKTSRTYIDGISGFCNEKQITAICKTLKEALGCGCLERILPDTKLKIYGFTGDHRERIRAMLVKNYKIPADKIIINE